MRQRRLAPLVLVTAILVAGCARSTTNRTAAIGVVLGAPSATVSAAGGSVQFQVAYTNADVVSLTAADVQVQATGTATATPLISGTGVTRTVTLTGLVGDGNITITILAGTASNVLGGAAPSATSAWAVTVDSTPPTAPATVTPSGTVAISVSGQLRDVPVTWSPSADAGSGLNRYEIAIGTTPGGTEILGFTSTGSAAAAFTVAALSCIDATDYFFRVRGIDNAGNVGAPGISAPWHPALFDSVPVAVGTTPRGIAMGDLDADGDVDVALANAGSDNVSVLWNDGRAVFAAGGIFGSGGTVPVAIAAGDLDGDGDVDLVVSNSTSNNLGVLLNTGGGGFAAAVTYATGVGPGQLRLGDIDGDLDLDVVVVNNGAASISVLRGNGNGTFAAAVHLPAGVGVSLKELDLGDIDGDGDLDVVVAVDAEGNVEVMRNLGGGVLDASVVYAVGASATSVAIGDFDGDGRRDLAVTDPATKGLVLLRNTGNADPAAFAAAGTTVVLINTSDLQAGDIDGDGDLDLVTLSPNGGSSNVQLLVNDGAGVFTRTDLATDNNPLRAAIGRLDGNSYLDVVISKSSSGQVQVMKNAASQ